jgi:DNA-directed RNA polymerase subunit K/omega
MPGSKSPFFKIKLSGTKITDPAIREIIEKDIKLAIEQIKPAHTELLKVEWVN